MRIFSRIFIYTAFLTLSVIGKSEDRRDWQNAEGTKSFMGDYLRMEGSNVIIKKDGLDEISVPVKKLHKDDIAWLKSRVNKEGAAEPSDTGVFDGISFGDSRDEVVKKLKKSKIIEVDRKDNSILSADNAFNGMYMTKEQIGGLTFRFSCEWENDLITQIDLKSEGVRYSNYPDGLQEAWSGMRDLLSQIYGIPNKENPTLPPSYEVEGNGAAVGTHRWKLDNGAIIILGPAHDPNDEKAYLLVRIYE